MEKLYPNLSESAAQRVDWRWRGKGKTIFVIIQCKHSFEGWVTMYVENNDDNNCYHANISLPIVKWCQF